MSDELKMGDVVEVNYAGSWMECIFIKQGKKNGIIGCKISDENDFKEERCFGTCWYLNWRILKEPEYIQFTYDDYEQLIGKAVKDKAGSNISIITSVNTDSVYLGPQRGGYNYYDLFIIYEFINLVTKETSPCGKLKESPDE